MTPKDYLKGLDAETNDHGVYSYISKKGNSAMNLEYILQEYADQETSSLRKELEEANEEVIIRGDDLTMYAREIRELNTFKKNCQKLSEELHEELNNNESLKKELARVQESLLDVTRAALEERAKSAKLVEALKFPNKSEWIQEFKESWYKDNNGILTEKATDGLWKGTERIIDMIHKYQRNCFENKLAEYEGKGPDISPKSTT